MTNPAPQPSAQVDQTVTVALQVLGMAVMSLELIPGVPPQIKLIVAEVSRALQQAYMTYKANPSADVIAQVKVALDQALDEASAVLHPVGG